MTIARKRLVEQAVLSLAPEIPVKDLAEVASHALHTAAFRRAAPETAAWLSLVSYVRHKFTQYDAMLRDGYDRDSARHFCLEPTNQVLHDWGGKRQVSNEPDGDDSQEACTSTKSPR